MHVKEAEASQSGVHVDALVSKGMGGANVADMIDNETSAIKRKEMEIASLRDQAAELGDSQGKSLKESMDALEENREADNLQAGTDRADEDREEKNTGSGKTDAGTIDS